MARQQNTTTAGEPFDTATIEAVWERGKSDAGFITYKKDVCGASMQWNKYGEMGTYGWEIDHIKPVAKGGTDDLSNLQPLQWQNNRQKGDNWPDWDCKNEY